MGQAVQSPLHSLKRTAVSPDLSGISARIGCCEEAGCLQPHLEWVARPSQALAEP
jgi:hypothetical protein